MWCNWGLMGGRMWWSHSFGFIGLLLLLAGMVFVFFLIWRKSNTPAKLECPACKGLVQHAYLRCPYCGTTLKRHCQHCAGIIESGWEYCPSCEAKSKVQNR